MRGGADSGPEAGVRRPAGKRIILSLVAAVALFFGRAGADCPRHLPTNGKDTKVPKVTAHECHELAGTVLADLVIPFDYDIEKKGNSPLWGTVQTRVVRSKATGELHFYYQIHVAGAADARDGIEFFCIFGIGGIPLEAWVGYRGDAAGFVEPRSIFASWWNYNKPPRLNGIHFWVPRIHSGEKSNMLLIKSKAKGYSREGTLSMDTSMRQLPYALKGVYVPK